MMRVSLDGGITNNDAIAGLTGVSYGGNLVITNVGASPLVSAAQFKIFSVTGTALGNFNAVTVLPPGYASFNPASGILTIVPPPAPTFNPVAISAGNLILTGSGGIPNGTYSLLTTTNVATPVSTWTTNTSGTFDGGGNFSNTIPVLQSELSRYFVIKTP
jgi:hypothetical protein